MEIQANRPKRIKYIDIIKGMGILLVVLGHNDLMANFPLIERALGSFRMPLFFFLSGMFVKPDTSWLVYLIQKAKRLLLPFYFTLLVIFFGNVSFGKQSIQVAAQRLLKGAYGNGHTIEWTPLWFLPHLFVVSLFAILILRLVNNRLRLTLIMACLVSGIWIGNTFYPFVIGSIELYGLPYNVDVLPISAFFFMIGYESRRIKIVDGARSGWLKHKLTPLIALFVLAVATNYSNYQVDLDGREFKMPVIALSAALAGIALMLSVSTNLVERAFISRFLIRLGTSSLVIFIFHMPIQEFWSVKLARLVGSEALGYFGGFVAGVVVPLLISRFFLEKDPLANKIFKM